MKKWKLNAFSNVSKDFIIRVNYSNVINAKNIA